MKIGIIVAMDKELRQLQSLFNSSNVLVQKCGIGKVNAALGAQRMIYEFHPDVIISSGCAGGNGDDIKLQDIIVGAEVCYHDVYCGTAIDDTTVYGQVQGLPVRYQADPHLLEKARQLGTIQLPDAEATTHSTIHSGLIVTGDCRYGVVCHRPDLLHQPGAIHLVPRHQRHTAPRHRRLDVPQLLGHRSREVVPADQVFRGIPLV